MSGISSATRAPDGRLVRRLRNEDAVRDAVLEMLAADEPITPESLVERSGVALRTVYRRFNSLPGAIDSAISARMTQLGAEIADTAPPPGTLDDRVAALVFTRLAWLDEVQPMLDRVGVHHAAMVDDILIRDIERRFPDELAALAEGQRGAVLAMLGVTLRLASLRYVCTSFSFDRERLVSVVSEQIACLLRHEAAVAA